MAERMRHPSLMQRSQVRFLAQEDLFYKFSPIYAFVILKNLYFTELDFLQHI